MMTCDVSPVAMFSIVSNHNALMWLSRCLFTLFVGGIQVGGREVGWAVGQESGGKGGWGVGGVDG